jgi:hypothetical protein
MLASTENVVLATSDERVLDFAISFR